MNPIGEGDRLTAELSRYVCASYPWGWSDKHTEHGPPGSALLPTTELTDRRRIEKIGEEFGEVIDAYGSYVGENPRKASNPAYPPKSLDDVKTELLDVALTALGAFDHLDEHSGQAFNQLLIHARARHERAGLRTDRINGKTLDEFRASRRLHEASVLGGTVWTEGEIYQAWSS